MPLYPSASPTPARSVRTRRRALVFSLVAALALSGGTATGTATGSTVDGSSATTTAAAAPDQASGLRAKVVDAVHDMSDTGVPGVIVHARAGDHRWDLSAGESDLVAHRAARVGDRVRIGSVTKTYIAVVLLQLQQEDRLDLDDPVERWLPGVVHGDGIDGRDITVRMLLNHSSGLPEYMGGGTVFHSYFASGHWDRVWTPRRLVRLAMTMKPFFAPGTDAGYSNTNYVLAGMVIRAVTGHSPAREVTRRIVRPLHLTRTSYPISDPAIPGRHLQGYLSNHYYPFEKVTGLGPSWAGAAGAIISTPAEVARFHRAVFDGRLLDDEQLRELTTVVRNNGDPSLQNGLGFGKRRICGHTVWWKDGAYPGYLTVSLSSRDGSRQLAFAVNSDSYVFEHPEAAKAQRELERVLFCD